MPAPLLNPHTVKLQRKNWQSMMIINARKSSRGKAWRTEWRSVVMRSPTSKDGRDFSLRPTRS